MNCLASVPELIMRPFHNGKRCRYAIITRMIGNTKVSFTPLKISNSIKNFVLPNNAAIYMPPIAANNVAIIR